MKVEKIKRFSFILKKCSAGGCPFIFNLKKCPFITNLKSYIDMGPTPMMFVE
jgi:hypothetical protein